MGELFFGSNQWYPTEKWLFNALDIEDNETEKTFALSGINTAAGINRVTDLLIANNNLLERARNAEAREKALSDEISQFRVVLARAQIAIKTGEDLKSVVVGKTEAPSS
jgi:type IV secretory pathway VirB4 component